MMRRFSVQQRNRLKELVMRIANDNKKQQARGTPRILAYARLGREGLDGVNALGLRMARIRTAAKKPIS